MGKKAETGKLLKQLLAQRRAAKGQTRNTASAGLNRSCMSTEDSLSILSLSFCLSTDIPFGQLLPTDTI